MSLERVIRQNEHEIYWRFEAMAYLLQAYSKHDAEYVVQDVYLDQGQNWMWTTICRKGWRECQILSPRVWHNLVDADTPEKFFKVYNEIINGEYFFDK